MQMRNTYIIKKNIERYPNIAEYLPDKIIVLGLLSQAEKVTEILTNYFPGCNGLFYVEGEL